MKNDPVIHKNRGLQQLPTGMWRVRVFYRGKQHHIGCYERRKYAEAALDRVRLQIAMGTFIPPSVQKKLDKEEAAAVQADSVAIVDWANTWLVNLADGGASPGTISTYRSALRSHILPMIGHHRLAAVEPAHCRAVIDHADTLGAKENAYRVMSAMFRAAIKDPDVTLNASPLDGIDPPRKKKRNAGAIKTSQIIDASDLEEIMHLMPEHLRVAPLIAYTCGLRLGEVLGLQRRDFRDLDNPDRATVTIERQWHTKLSPPDYAPPKVGSSGTVPIAPTAVERIREHLDKFVTEKPTSPLLPSQADPTRPMSQTSFDIQWRKARDQVKPGFRFHDLRHTALTNFARQGATTADLMKFGRHSDHTTSMNYQHSELERMRSLVAGM